MENIIPLGEPTDIYADLVYTPTERKLSIPEKETKTQSSLDWASDFLHSYTPVTSGATSQEVDSKDGPSSDEKDTWSGYWKAWQNSTSGSKAEIETEPKSEPKAPDIKPKIANYSGSNFEKFKKAYADSGVNQNEFNFWAALANHESGFNNYIQNQAGAPAYGYFQFMEGKVGSHIWDNITKFAGVDIETFRNNPVLQIQAAHKMKEKILKGFSDADRKKTKELGYTDSALVRGAWLAGVKGVKRFLHQGINASDNHWDKKNHRGSNVRAAMEAGNGYFSKGGILKTR